MSSADFNRHVVSLLGLPIDLTSMDQAINAVDKAVASGQPLFISTPNLNFLRESFKDDGFRHSIIESELSLADGMPLIWIARLLQLPRIERIAGSEFFSRLVSAEGRPAGSVKVCFVGGQEGAGGRACNNINALNGPVRCTGAVNPGFGSIEDLSKTAIVERINASKADFVVVALGAKKGQAWIHKNKTRLRAPVISHLGAVVNFVAGTVRRAPIYWQKIGLEWLWRIKEEPKLWKRYFFDGIFFLKLLFTHVLPYAVLAKQCKKKYAGSVRLSVGEIYEGPEFIRISLVGNSHSANLNSIRELFSECSSSGKNIEIDFSQVDYIDAYFLGLLLILFKHTGSRLRVANCSDLIRKLFYYNNASFLLG